MSIEQQVREYILENLFFTSESATLSNDDSLLERGVIDSTGVLELIFFLEQQFGIKVHDAELIPENFDSLNNLVQFVQKKKTSG